MNQGIYYLYEYETGQRKRNLGFLQISHQYRSCMMTLHLKSLPLSPGTALELTGHAVGGVCPFALPENVPVYLDGSLKDKEVIYPACGSSNSAIRLTPDELERYSHSRGWVDVCKQQV